MPAIRYRFPYLLLQLIKKGILSFRDFMSGYIDWEPASSIDLRIFVCNSRSARPFHWEQVALYGRSIKITTNKPCIDYLSARLLYWFKRLELPRYREPGLLMEFALSGF